jgi:hypothetical protein
MGHPNFRCGPPNHRMMRKGEGDEVGVGYRFGFCMVHPLSQLDLDGSIETAEMEWMINKSANELYSPKN